jgi:hypothetical protein
VGDEEDVSTLYLRPNRWPHLCGAFNLERISMFKENSPVLVWDSNYWWKASVVVSELGSQDDVMLVRFENGATAAVKASSVCQRLTRDEENALTPLILYPMTGKKNLPAGSWALTGVYVVSHFEPTHAIPHEIVVRTETALPQCKLCRNVRFSWKCSATQLIEENAFFKSEPRELVTHLRSEAAKVRQMTQKSRNFISNSRQFLANWDSARGKSAA